MGHHYPSLAASESLTSAAQVMIKQQVLDQAGAAARASRAPGASSALSGQAWYMQQATRHVLDA